MCPRDEKTRRIIEAHAAAAGFRVHVRVEVRGTPARPQSDVQDQLLRIAREAVSNSVCHAHASRGDLELAYEGGEIRLRVRDDGVGFDPARVGRGHFGLVGMSGRSGSEEAFFCAPRTERALR